MHDAVRFGPFELDLGRRELRKHGIRLRIPDQSFEILTMLVQRGGELVDREEIRDRLWPNGTVVEFEHSVNSAVKRLRDALRDSPSKPRFIETIPKRGYRFLPPVELVNGSHGETARYRISGEAGRGAMGVVYRAEETELGRTVALKFVAEELANDSSALERLRQEARIAASLNHPGICTLYGLEQHDGRACLVMELLEGTPLDRLLAAGPLPADRAIAIAIDVSAALSYAHARGIVHRDIKPANLFITTGGTTKLTDFGIAQRIGDSGTARVGTPSYASPEQREGSGTDERSDIFSLGAVLYEMLTAHPLFGAGGLPTQVAYPQDTPEELKLVIARCVAPNPSDRFQSAAELQGALENLRVSRGTVRKSRSHLAALVVLVLAISGAAVWVFFPRASGPRFRAIAVLPFVNLSADPDQEYLADGMTEALTSDLAELGAFRVISRTSAMTFKGTREPVAKIARRLSVDALLEGSVSRSGGRVRVVAQLIDPAKDTHVWSRTWERDFVDVLRLQSELAEAIVREIAVRPGASVRAVPVRQMKPDAYEAYLKGMFHLSKFTPDGFERGVSYLEQATQKDPSDPAAWAKLAMGYAIMGHERSPEEFARAKAAATRSLELGGPEPEAYAVLGMAELYSEWKFESGASNLRRALQLNPSLAEARRAYSWYLVLSGVGQEALAEMRRAVELEPLVPIYPADLAWQYLDQRDCDAALKHALQALELNPGFGQALAVLGLAYQVKGMHGEAEAAHRKAAADEVWRWPLARTLARSGRTVEARKLAADLARKPGPMHKWGLAIIHASLGDKDAALQFLEQAFQQRFTFLPWDHSPNLPAEGTDSDLFAPLRQDPRFHDLGRRIGVPFQR